MKPTYFITTDIQMTMPKFTSQILLLFSKVLHILENLLLKNFTGLKVVSWTGSQRQKYRFSFSMQNNHEKTTAEEASRLEAQSLHWAITYKSELLGTWQVGACPCCSYAVSYCCRSLWSPPTTPLRPPRPRGVSSCRAIPAWWCRWPARRSRCR